jgi:hypothetical protein
MKTKIKLRSKKKVSKLKNKKKTQFKWKGKGGGNSNPKNNYSVLNLENTNTKTNNTNSNNTNSNKKNPLEFKIAIPQRGTTLIGSEISENWDIKEHKIEDLYYIEVTNSFIQVNFKELYIVLSLDILSIDKLQYYIKKGKVINFSNTFLGLTENTIILKSLNKGGDGQYRTGSSNEFIDIYEDNTSYMISYDENLYNLINPLNRKFYINVKTVNNPSLTTMASEDIDWLNTIIESLNKKSSDSKKDQNQLDYFLTLSPRQITKSTKIFNKKDRNGNIECEDLNVDHTKLIIDEFYNVKERKPYVIIGYPAEKMKSYLDLLDKNELAFHTMYQDQKNNMMKHMAELHNYIYDNQKSPDPLKHINTDTKQTLESQIHKFYGYDDYYKYIANFYDNELLKGLVPDEITKIKQTESPKYPINKEYGIPYDPDFQNKFKELQKAFYNQIAAKCLNKPMMKINYVFLIFKKHTEEGEYKDKYVPALFNFRELKHKHYPILKRVEHLIKTRLSKIYGIIEDETKEDYKLWYSHYNYGDIFHIKTEYIHTMSNIQQQAYKYKNSISLEELIYMLSIPNVDLINLRLDYQRKNNRFSWLNGENMEEKHKKESENKVKKKFIPKCRNIFDKKVENNSVIKHTPTNEDVSHLLHMRSIIVLMFVETGNSYTFIYKSGIDNKFYIIKIKSNLCKIAIQLFNYLNKYNILNLFYNDFHKKKIIDFKKALNIETDLQLYEVEFNRPINAEDYKNIMRYNPLLIRSIKQISNIPIDDKPISKTTYISMFLESPLVNITQFNNYNIKIPNPYLKKPFLVRNFLSTDTYIEEFKQFKVKYNKNIKNFKNNLSTYNELSYNYPINKFNEHNTIKYQCSESRLGDDLGNKYSFELYEGQANKRKINRIFFNPGNCGYNFIEICDKHKSVIWIVPLNSTHSEKIKEDNEEEFQNVPIFIGNFANLNYNHINMLNELNKLFNTEIYECFFNIGSIISEQFSLHVHRFNINISHYSSFFAKYQQGSRLEKLISTKTVINLLNLGKKYNYEYYNNYECILIHNASK